MSTDFNFMFSPSTQSNGFYSSNDNDSDSESLLNNNSQMSGSILTMDNSGFEIFGGSLASLNGSFFSEAAMNDSLSFISYNNSSSGSDTETIGSVAYAGAGSSNVETIGSVACASVGADSGAGSCSSGGGGFSSFC